MSSSPRALLRRLARGGVDLAVAIVAFLPFVGLALISRLARRNGVGLGPEPLINNVHHARALRQQGFSATTFVSHEYYITNRFDVRWLTGRPFNHYALFLKVIFSFEAIYIYFNGGPLGWTMLRPVEPWLYKLAGVKVVVMPYGGDVQDFGVHDDVVYRAAYLADYPDFVRHQMASRKRNVRRWVRHANWVISGCDWVNYLPHWHTLMLAHFSIDTEEWKPRDDVPPAGRMFTMEQPLRVLHAPNHRAIKGTAVIEQTVARLRAEGVPVELVIVQKMPNQELKKLVQEIDVVAEQLVIGWYGIFALEAMACAKPVLTYIAPQLERLYLLQGLLDRDELPITKVDHLSLEPALRAMARGERNLPDLGRRSREYVLRRHSLGAVGAVFAGINQKLGVRPTAKTENAGAPAAAA